MPRRPRPPARIVTPRRHTSRAARRATSATCPSRSTPCVSAYRSGVAAAPPPVSATDRAERRQRSPPPRAAPWAVDRGGPRPRGRGGRRSRRAEAPPADAPQWRDGPRLPPVPRRLRRPPPGLWGSMLRALRQPSLWDYPGCSRTTAACGAPPGADRRDGRHVVARPSRGRHDGSRPCPGLCPRRSRGCAGGHPRRRALSWTLYPARGPDTLSAAEHAPPPPCAGP